MPGLDRAVSRKSMPLALLLGLLGAMAAPGCVDPFDNEDEADSGPADLDHSDVSLDQLASLRVLPADATLVTDGATPGKMVYRALGKFADGRERDVTTKVTFTALSPKVGGFNENVFYPAISWGGKTTVQASTTNGVSGSTSLTVVLTRSFVKTGVPQKEVSALQQTTADSGPGPMLAYPMDGVLIPTNLLELEFQWTPGAGQKWFELSLKNDGTDIRIYTPCNKVGSGCGYVPTAVEWKAMVAALRGQDPVKIMVRGKDQNSSTIGASSTRSMSVAEEDIQGGLYYWNATPGSVVRYDFGKPNQKAKNFYTAADAKALFCVGCHAMSLDGKRMAVGLDMPAPAPLKVLEVDTIKLLSSGAANFMAFSPNGTYIITSDGNSMVARDALTYKALPPNPLRVKGTMPDWSPDSTRIVYAEPAQVLPIPFGTPGISKGSIKIMAFDPKTTTFSKSWLTLVASKGENNYYPTFSPDNKWIVFNRAQGSSYDATDAALWIVSADGKGKPVELKNANQGLNLCNSWPKFSPFLQKYKGRTLMWITYSSRRDYGLRLKGKARAQLWMAAIEPTKGEMTTDPSQAGFWLPFQDINTGNHIGQWTIKVVRKKCGPDAGCPAGQKCVNGLCEPK